MVTAVCGEIAAFREIVPTFSPRETRHALGVQLPTTFSIRGVSISGGNPNVLAVGQSYPDSLAANASAVYWANSGDGAVRMVAK